MCLCWFKYESGRDKSCRAGKNGVLTDGSATLKGKTIERGEPSSINSTNAPRNPLSMEIVSAGNVMDLALLLGLIKQIQVYQKEMFTKIDKKVENGATRMLFMEKKVRELHKKVKELRIAIVTGSNIIRQEVTSSIYLSTEHLGKYIKKVVGNEYKPLHPQAAAFEATVDDLDTESTEGADPSPTGPSRSAGHTPPSTSLHKYGLRQRGGAKFSNTAANPVDLTPSPSPSPKAP